MKLLAVTLFTYKGAETTPVTLGMASDLSAFGYFQRSTVREMLLFTSRMIVQRTAPGQRQTVRQEDYYCHAHVRECGLAAVAVCDKDYPPTAAFSVAAKVMDEYAAANADEAWRRAAADDQSAQAILEPALQRFQDPVAADKLTKIQRDLDETKVGVGWRRGGGLGEGGRGRGHLCGRGCRAVALRQGDGLCKEKPRVKLWLHCYTCDAVPPATPYAPN